MSKAILMSIQPKWCEPIISGEKTIELRKTRPKLYPPFKCYIYCTKPKMITRYVFRPEDYPEYMRPDKTVFCKTPDASSPYCSAVNGNGKVIGEFTCNLITGLKANNGIQTYYNGIKETCLTDAEIIKYASGKMIYFWHISDLKIYDEPNLLSDLKPWNRECAYSDLGLAIPKCEECNACNLKKAPQSWCYVEEIKNEADFI